jgi:hypothetical protein
MSPGPLRDSHIWPKFAYKRYVSDQNKGGSFTDLGAIKHHNKQVTDYLLCQACEQRFSRFEAYAAEFLNRVEREPQLGHAYDKPLHDFAVSVSWRVAQHNVNAGVKDREAKLLRSACKTWRLYLLGKKNDIAQFSQHAFIAFGQNIEGKDAEWHKGLGGEVFPDEWLVLSRIGPLLIVGLLGRRHLSLKEIEAWERSRLQLAGGAVRPIAKLRHEEVLTPAFARLLNKLERRLVMRAVKLRD